MKVGCAVNYIKLHCLIVADVS